MADKKEPNVEDKVKEIRPFPKWASILIVIISLLEVVFIVLLFAISFFKHIPFCFFEKEAESSLLASGIAIIGIAIAVWAGLNIVNAIERKDIEELKDSYTELQKQSDTIKESKNKINELSEKTTEIKNSIKEIEEKQKSADNAALLNELYKTNQDAATRVIIEKMRNIKTISNDKLLSLLEIERRFSSVYYLHSSDNSYNAGLLKEAKHGISLSESLLKEESTDTVQLYLKYRIAEFYFYSGYCCGKLKIKTFFDSAIKIYYETYERFGAIIPPIETFENYSDIIFKKCDEDSAEISSYFCNSIGEAYSKMIQAKNNLFCPEEEIKTMEQKAIFYCGYAANWGSREVYWRNFGCAIERTYGVTTNTYDGLIDIYKTAFKLGANQKTLKTLLSCTQKLLAKGFGISDINPNEDRIPPLNDIYYYDNFLNSSFVEKAKMDDMLKELFDYSSKAKTIYPSDTVGYVYSCFYNIYMCIINRNKTNEIDKHKALGNEDLQILKILAPNAALTKILGNDLAAF